MKIDFRKYAAALREGSVRVLRRYPIETALLTVFTALFVWWTEAENFRLFPAECLWVFPLFVSVALIVNTLAGNSPWRRVYYVVWTPLVPLLSWAGLQEWVDSEQFAITLGILVPLALLLCRRTRDNRRFTGNAVLYLRAIVVALLFANVALGLFEATLWSTAYIFGFDDVHWIERVAVDAVPIANFWGAAMLFLLLIDRWEQQECRLARIGEVLVNWVVTPALVVYAAILHLYAAKILFVWSLPRGGVAYLVFGFILLAFLVRMLRELVEKRVAEWFYGRFSYVMIVPVCLFWIGAIRRIDEYGLTAPRVYLLVCGIVMTLAVLFLFLRSGRYTWLFISAFVLFAVVAYVPAFSPSRIGLRSQRARFERLGHELGMLDDEGRFIVRSVPLADSVRRADYADLFSAMQYVELRDTTFEKSLGLERDFGGVWRLQSDLCPWLDADFLEVVEISDIEDIELPRNFRVRPDAAYPVLYTNINHRWAEEKDGLCWNDDSLHLMLGGRRLLSVSAEEFLERQMEAAGVTLDRLRDMDEEQTVRLLDYRDEDVRILFGSIKIDRRDSVSCKCAGAWAELVWTR